MLLIIKKKNYVTDIEWLGLGTHSHLLPKLDDGATNLVASLKLVQGLHKLGYTRFFCSPHIFTELYSNTPETILWQSL
jgi:protein-tyrosine phosphatase